MSDTPANTYINFYIHRFNASPAGSGLKVTRHWIRPIESLDAKLLQTSSITGFNMGIQKQAIGTIVVTGLNLVFLIDSEVIVLSGTGPAAA